MIDGGIVVQMMDLICGKILRFVSKGGKLVVWESGEILWGKRGGAIIAGGGIGVWMGNWFGIDIKGMGGVDGDGEAVGVGSEVIGVIIKGDSK